MSKVKEYTIPEACELMAVGNELEKMLAAYQAEILRLRSLLSQAVKYQKNYLTLKLKTGYEVCPICDNGVVKGVNSEEMPCGLSIHLYSACATCGGEGVLKTNKP